MTAAGATQPPPATQPADLPHYHQAMLAQKILGVMKAIDRVPKRGRNDFHHYDYAMESDVADVVRAALIEQQLVLLPNVVHVEERDVTTRAQKTETVTTVTVEMTFLDAETGAERSFRMIGAGQDPGDKGAMKAVTAATKYAQLKAFVLGTGDDPEGDTRTDETAAEREPGQDDDERPFVTDDPPDTQLDDGPEYHQPDPPPGPPARRQTTEHAARSDDCISEAKVRFLHVLCTRAAQARGEPVDKFKATVLAKVQKELNVTTFERIPWRGNGFKQLIAWIEAHEQQGKGRR